LALFMANLFNQISDSAVNWNGRPAGSPAPVLCGFPSPPMAGIIRPGAKMKKIETSHDIRAVFEAWAALPEKKNY
jgi:hypothetical protein